MKITRRIPVTVLVMMAARSKKQLKRASRHNERVKWQRGEGKGD